jgi:hypothetical protein
MQMRQSKARQNTWLTQNKERKPVDLDKSLRFYHHKSGTRNREQQPDQASSKKEKSTGTSKRPVLSTGETRQKRGQSVL